MPFKPLRPSYMPFSHNNELDLIQNLMRNRMGEDHGSLIDSINEVNRFKEERTSLLTGNVILNKYPNESLYDDDDVIMEDVFDSDKAKTNLLKRKRKKNKKRKNPAAIIPPPSRSTSRPRKDEILENIPL